MLAKMLLVLLVSAMIAPTVSFAQASAQDDEALRACQPAAAELVKAAATLKRSSAHGEETAAKKPAVILAQAQFIQCTEDPYGHTGECFGKVVGQGCYRTYPAGSGICSYGGQSSSGFTLCRCVPLR